MKIYLLFLVMDGCICNYIEKTRVVLYIYIYIYIYLNGIKRYLNGSINFAQMTIEYNLKTDK